MDLKDAADLQRQSFLPSGISTKPLIRYNLMRSRFRFFPVHWLSHLQWPAMVATLLSAWLVGSQNKHRRRWGFWIFLLSNVLWGIWSWHDHAYALVALQLGLAVLNIRGVSKNEPH